MIDARMLVTVTHGGFNRVKKAIIYNINER